MQFDPNNKVVKLCARGMDLEGKGNREKARDFFFQAWREATNDFEKFTAAHYVARHQKSVIDKLKWDRKALRLAKRIEDDTVKCVLSSLYLNIAKSYEDLDDYRNAKLNYEMALSFTKFLNEDGYGNMVKYGILNGIDRVKNHIQDNVK